MILRDIPFTIPRDKVLVRLKFNVALSETNEKVDHLIDAMMDECYVLADAQASIHDFAIKEHHDDTLVLDDTDFFIKSVSLMKHLATSYKLSLFCCTIGKEYASVIQSLIDNGEVAKATILDAVTSEAVEALANAVTAIIQHSARAERATITSRFSPGYDDWDITEQKALLKLLDAKKIDIELTEQCLMVPEKSITACMGWNRQ